jgi:WD40 repeat protein
LLDKNGNPRVTDFGLAKKLETDSGLTGSGQIMGTPSYMPPEQAGGKRGDVGPASDVYALGATLYALFTGRPPFQAATAMDTVLMVVSDEPVPPRRLNVSIPLDLETICLKCLEKEPGNRYPSAAALGAELQRYLTGEPIHARPVGQLERAWRWCRRNRALSSAILAAGLGLVAAAGISVVYAVDRGSAARRLESLNRALKDEGDRTRSALRETNRQLSIVATERAERHRQSSDSGRGALQLVEAVHFALEAGDADLERSARATLGIWENDLHRLRSVAGGAELVEGVRLGWTAFGAEGRRALVAWFKFAEVLDVATGNRIGPSFTFPGAPLAVAISPDGKVAAIAATDIPDPAQIASMVSGVRLFETVSGKSVGVMIHHPNKANSKAPFPTIQAIAFSADGKTLLTGGLDRTVRYWDVATGKEMRAAIEHPEAVMALIVSGDGRVVGAKGMQTIRVLDSESGQPIGKQLKVQAGAFSAALSGDGQTLLTGGGDGFVRFWSCNSGQETSRIDGGHGPVLAVALSPDGKRLLASTQSGAVRLWETATRMPIGAPMHHAGEVSVLAFLPDGKAALTATMDGTVRIWELSTGLHPQQSWKPGGFVRALAFRPDGRVLLASYGYGLARLWDPASGAPVGPQLKHSGNAESVNFSPDGKTAVTGGWGLKPTGDSFFGELFRWDASNGESLGGPLDFVEMVRSVAFLPDGRSLLVLLSAKPTTGLSVRPYDPVTAVPLSNAIKFGSERVDHAVLSLDGKRLLTASNLGNSAQLWDLATGRPLGPPIKHPDWVTSVAFRPDGKAFATGCKDQIARLWDADTRESVGKPMINGYQVVAIAFSPDGQTLLTGCRDFLSTAGEARLWNATTGQPLTPPLPHAHAVSAVAFRPDGKAVATGDAVLSFRGPGEGNISIWNLPARDPSDIAELRRRMQVWTGLKLQDADRFEALEPEAWQKLAQQLEAGRQPRAYTVDGNIH